MSSSTLCDFVLQMCLQKLSYSAPVLPKHVAASQSSVEDVAIFTQSPWTDMLKDLDLNGN